MYLDFPNIDIVAFAITSGVISEDVAAAPVEMGTTEHGSLCIKVGEKLANANRKQLRLWRIKELKNEPDIEFHTFNSWFQLFPLQQTTSFEPPGSQEPVLFEIADEAEFTEIVNEILRQGNDRQSFRHLTCDGQDRLLLRVVGAPYYSLLRSHGSTKQANTRAFVERVPRVWIQAGHEHRFADKLSPAAGQHLLLSAPADWRVLDEKPFRDIYEASSFKLPTQPVALADTDRKLRLRVPVRLVRGGSDEPAELFVIRNNAVKQLDEFVAAASDEVLERLAFVATEPTETQPDPVVVIRIRPGRSAPPVLVFDAVAYRRYLKIPNLFVPVGQRVHPPLRRDAVRKLLASDDTKLVWLETDSSDGGDLSRDFVPTVVDDSSFRPLNEWIDYTIERDRETIAAWQSSHVFEFEGFVCSEGKKPKSKAKRRTSQMETEQARSQFLPPPEPSQGTPTVKRVRKFEPPEAPPTDAIKRALHQKLGELESQFFAADIPLDDPARESAWAQMAETNLALNHFTDAGICRQHEVWEQSEPNADSLAAWFHGEAVASVSSGMRVLCDDRGEVDERRLRGWIAAQEPSAFEVAQFAAWLAGATRVESQAEMLLRNQSAIQKYLEQNESLLAVRSCWLAWSGLASLAEDELMLARARDRVLDRLYRNGLAPDRDLPAFLRMGGATGLDRFRVVRDRVRDLHQLVRHWSKANRGLASVYTLNYVDLVFAFGFARFGEASLASDLVRQAENELPHRRDPVHRWLLRAFSHRIQQASAGESAQDSLPDTLLNSLNHLSKLERYTVDRLREHSAILEPNESLDPYRAWHGKSAGDFDYDLEGLFDVISRTELVDRLRGLFELKLSPEQKSRLVARALELSTRIGEKFAVKMLGHVVPLDGKLKDTILRAKLLGRGLTIAAHYDQSRFAQACLERMYRLIDKQKHNDVKTLEALEGLLSRTFVSLRRLGMRGEIASLLDRLTKRVRSKAADDIEPERLGVLLQLAGGWFYFGEDRGWQDIDRARDILLQGKLLASGYAGAMKHHPNLAVSYIRAVGQAPLDDAMARMTELFSELTGIQDSSTVNTHYSLKQLDVVEALIQTIASDGFTASKESQRWLDDGEFLIRRRIHRDVRSMMSS